MDKVFCDRHLSQWFYLQNITESKTQGTLQKSGQKGCKTQRNREFTVRLYMLVTSEITQRNSHQYGCLNTS